MTVSSHPQIAIRELSIGRERAPLLLIDNLVADPEALVEQAAGKHYTDVMSYYPGVRAKAPLSYQQFITGELRGLIEKFFGLQVPHLRFTGCHFSLVTTPPERLTHLQRIPHIDSTSSNELAFIHYLFKGDLGGTAFYRHRSTGFEYVDEARKLEYFDKVAFEKAGPNSPPAEYINGDTPLYEQIAAHSGVFNRLLMYRRNSLHSGSVRGDSVASSDPRTGRLSINGFVC